MSAPLVTVRPPQFIVWHHHVPTMLPDVDAVARFAQARGLVTCTAWVLDDVAEACRVVVLYREDLSSWMLVDNGTFQFRADPSDDPVVLEVVDLFARRSWRLNRVAREDWSDRDPRDEHGACSPYGWLPPRVLGLTGWVATFCPELIAAQMAWLTKRQRKAYLASIDLRLALHVKHHGLEHDRLMQTINDQLTGHGLAVLTTEVEMRVMESKG